MPQYLAPCGTMTAYKRHKRRGEPVDEACAAACRKQKNDRVAARQEASAKAVLAAVKAAPRLKAEEVDPLAEALDSLEIVRAVLRDEGTPASAVAALTKRRDELVERIGRLRYEAPPARSSVVNDLMARREKRGTGPR